MQKTVGIICVIAWLLCGCTIDSVCDDWRAMVTFVIALITVCTCAAVLGHDTNKPHRMRQHPRGQATYKYH